MFKKLFFLGIFLFVPNFVFAATTSSVFTSDTQSTFTYNTSYVEFSGSVARLKATSPWMDSAWAWRETVTVTNPTIFTTTAGTELKVTITSANTDFWSNVESDGRSVRFTSSDGVTTRNYYIESFDSVGQTATIYVSVPSITRETTTTLYMYFGNSSATTASSESGTMLFNETFTAASVDQTKYSIVDANSVFTQDGTRLVGAAYEGSGLWHGIYATSSYAADPTQGIVFEADFSTSNVANKDQNILIGLKNTLNETATTFFGRLAYALYITGGYSAGCSNYTIRYRHNGDYLTNTYSGYNIACDTTYNTRIVVYPGNGADYFMKGGAFTDWTFLGHSSTATTTPLVPAVLKQEGLAYIDNVKMRHSTVTTSTEGLSLPRYGSTPVFTTTTVSAWEDLAAVGEPAVIYEDGMFKMWYSSGTSVGYATSTDGITWNRYSGNPVLAPSGTNGAFDKSYATRAEVYKDNGVYYMYYNGFETSQSGAGAIGLATSTDGITWNRYSGNPILSVTGVGWQSESLYNTGVVKTGGLWYMLYEGRGGGITNEIGLATSTDGITWNRYSGNPIITNGLTGTAASYAAAPNLLYSNGVFYTWYLYAPGDGTYRLARAHSTDAITWTRYSVADLSPLYGWEYISVSDPSTPVQAGDSVYMYYNGGNQNGIGAIGLIKYTGTLATFAATSTPFSFTASENPFRELWQSQGVSNTQYATTSPTIVNSGVAYSTLTSFDATTSGGTVTFQISPDNSTYYYWNGSAWTATSDSVANSNSAATINTNIGSFSSAHPNKTLYWRSYLQSTGAQTTSISSVAIGYTPRDFSAPQVTGTITFVWSGNGYQNSIENVTAGTQTGWFSGTSYQYAGINCGNTYQFKLHERNSSGVETGVSDAITVVTQCSGRSGSPDTTNQTVQPEVILPPPPRNLRLLSQTAATTTLTWNGEYMQYQVINDTTGVSSPWFFGNLYSLPKPSCGKKNEYRVRGRDFERSVSSYSNKLLLEEACLTPVEDSKTDPIFVPPRPTEPPPVINTNDALKKSYEKSLIRGRSSKSVYYIQNGNRYVFVNEKIYRSWFADFTQVKTVDDSVLALFMIGGSVKPKPNTMMIKLKTDPRVYLISGRGVLRWIQTEAVAKELFGSTWSKKVIDVSEAELSDYTFGQPLKNVNSLDKNTSSEVII